jgi:TRAP-type mannitol/chloroaromatic compound transport system permease small subunit
MQAVAATVRVIYGINGFLGRVFQCFPLLIVAICFSVVVMRYVFRTGSVPMQDLYIWLNGAMFMGISGYALMTDSHVRVDIFYREARTRTKAIVDMIGSVLFIGPFLWMVAWWGWPYVARSWTLRESSPNMGGLPGLFILKSFILIFVATVGLQALALFLRGVLVLADREDLLPPAIRYPSREV